MKTLRLLLAASAATFALLLHAATGTPAAPAADPSGSWKWAFTPPNGGQAFESVAKLAAKDGQLTGTVTGRMGEVPIVDGTVRDGIVAFSIVREREGRKFVIKYSGKLEGDTITGTFEVPGLGGDSEPMQLHWQATRVK